MRFYGTISGENRNVPFISQAPFRPAPRFLAVLHPASRFSEGKARTDADGLPLPPAEWALGPACITVAAGSRRFRHSSSQRRGPLPTAIGEPVELAVAVEVCDRESRRAGPGRVGRTGRGRECSIAVPKQNGDRAVAVVGDGQIQFSAVTEVGGQNSLRLLANRYR